jgi:hypothetical protein
MVAGKGVEHRLARASSVWKVNRRGNATAARKWQLILCREAV